MREKIPSEITELALCEATFKGSGVKLSPTLINFFFGNNGTGKSTIGKSIAVDSGVTWRGGRSASDYRIHVYNAEYIEKNLQSYHNMRGVYTVNEVNAEIQRQVEEKTAEKEKAATAHRDAVTAMKRKEDELEQALTVFQQECWDKTNALRRDFDKTQEKRKNKKSFAEAVLAVKGAKEHDVDLMARLYAAAFSDDAKKYTEFSEVADPTVLDTLSGIEVLQQKIVSGSDSPFAQFIQALNSSAWVRQGHEQFHASAKGKCPYCQRELPEDFESDLRSCFDTQYQSAMKALSDFYEAYRNAANALFIPLRNTPAEFLPGIDTTAYNDKLSAIQGVISTNLQIIKDKLNDPASVVELYPVSTLLQELSDIIGGFNKLIRENNAIIDSKPGKRAECIKDVWEHIAFVLAAEISSYLASKATLENQISALKTEIASHKLEVSTLAGEIAELNKNSVNTSDTIASVNALLRDSGFQGFSLREKAGTPNVYEVVRMDGSIATNLSEGERNFIAFLYFYHEVKGSDTADGGQKDKIVVIDDPVSSMDSGALFIVSALVREMIEVCENNAVGGDPVAKGTYIKQIFILTHNAYFHREITYNRVRNFQYVNFYLISKVDNHSTVRWCKKTNPEVMTEEINYNPVQNSYAALWEEYKALTAPIPLMNVIRRILEYYFLQLCGYDGSTLRQRILVDNKEKFIKPGENGQADYTQYQMAHAMLSYISANAVGINDGINFVDDCVDIEQTKETFRLVFNLMNQTQHYDMMMGNQ